MTDVFFSYSSKDRERVRPFRDALEQLGFTVFWDLETPAGQDWNSFIRSNLDRARSVLVFWSTNSLNSDPVKTEADLAKRDGKLIPVSLDDNLDESKLTLGHDRKQIKYVGDWNSEYSHPTWGNVLAEIETLATPLWLINKVAGLKGAFKAESIRLAHANNALLSLENELSSALATEREARLATSKAETEITILKSQIAQLNIAIDVSRNETADALRFLSATKRKMEDELSSAETKIQELKCEIDTLKADLAAVQEAEAQVREGTEFAKNEPDAATAAEATKMKPLEATSRPSQMGQDFGAASLNMQPLLITRATFSFGPGIACRATWKSSDSLSDRFKRRMHV